MCVMNVDEGTRAEGPRARSCETKLSLVSPFFSAPHVEAKRKPFECAPVARRHDLS